MEFRLEKNRLSQVLVFEPGPHACWTGKDSTVFLSSQKHVCKQWRQKHSPPSPACIVIDHRTTYEGLDREGRPGYHASG
ncbi:hypothetical protein STEG23_027912, partial [Scotinomys teguina]